MENSLLTIIIPTKDRGALFDKTIDALLHSIGQLPVEVIVINDSKTNRLTIDHPLKHRIRIINNNKSGVAAARNLGANEARSGNLLFMDDDILVSAENIKTLFDYSKKYPDSALNLNWEYPGWLTEKISKYKFGRYLVNEGYTSLKGWSKNMTWGNDDAFEVDLLASYFLFISRKTFYDVGGYNDSFPHAGAEDFEFATRARKHGVKCYCVTASTVLHNEEDRTTLLPWLKRKERSAETRRLAVEMGHREIALDSGKIKQLLMRIIYLFRGPLRGVAYLIPNSVTFDGLYSRLVNVLLSAYLHQGYFKN